MNKRICSGEEPCLWCERDILLCEYGAVGGKRRDPIAGSPQAEPHLQHVSTLVAALLVSYERLKRNMGWPGLPVENELGVPSVHAILKRLGVLRQYEAPEDSKGLLKP